MDQNQVEGAAAEWSPDTWTRTWGFLGRWHPESHFPCRWPHGLQIHQVLAPAFHVKSPDFPMRSKESGYKQHWKPIRPRRVKLLP